MRMTWIINLSIEEDIGDNDYEMYQVEAQLVVFQGGQTWQFRG
jgi:hypothetical protein